MGSKNSKTKKNTINNTNTNSDNGKTFYFYYDMSCQNLAVYPGTPSDEIKLTIRDLLGIPPTSKVEYLNENGDPLVVSSALPDKIKIYVKIKKTFTEKFIEEQKKKEKEKIETKNITKLISWTWLESSDPKNHKRKNENKTIYQKYNESMSMTKGTLKIESGEIYFTLLFEPLQCCVFAGICPTEDCKNDYISKLEKMKEDEEEEGEEEKEEGKEEGKIEEEKEEEKDIIDEKYILNKLDFWRIWDDYDDPHSTFPGPVIEAGFYINMDLKLLIIYDNKKNKEIKRQKIPPNWTKVCPAVNFKHSVSITISSDAVVGKPDFIKL
jgi:hypothetical protein